LLSAKRIVFVEIWHSKDSHHGITNELLDRATVTLEGEAHFLEVAIHYFAHGLSVESFPEAG